MLAALLQMHLMKTILQIDDGKDKIALLVGNLVLNDRQQKAVAL